jgi:hypothetical protein
MIARVKRLAIVIVVGCSTPSSHHVTPDGPGDPIACKAERDASLDRHCQVPADCVLVESEDCCGPIDLAVAVGTEGGFPAVETRFDACLACPPLGCAHQTEAEDGTPMGGGTIVATCIANRCTSVVQ